MIKNFTAFFSAAIFMASINLSAQSGTWVQKKSLYNLVAGRKFAVGFSINGKGYVGTGYSYGFGYLGAWNNDLWQYDTLTNSWTQMASMPTVGREYATAFVINNKAYVGCGVTASNSPYNDLWEYNPLSNSWTRKADMPNSGLSLPHSFTLNNKGFVGFGFDSAGYYQKGIWAYDPVKDKWTRKKDFPAKTIWESFAVSDGKYAYAGLGLDAKTNKYVSDIWQYDASSDAWTQKNDFAGEGRFNEASFVANNKLFIVGGENNKYKFINDSWVYNTSTDTWSLIGNFTGPSRGYPVSFTIGNNGYIATGYDATNNDKELGDLWELNTKNLQWRQRANLGGGPRDLAVSFNTGNIGIVATGEDGTRFKKDVWAYNSEKDYWKKLTDITYGKNVATGFSIGVKMYIGLGVADTSRSIINPVTKSKDFWVFNPIKQIWTQVADFGGGNRGAAVSFVLNGKAYVGTGYTDDGILTKDFWQYDPDNNTWKQQADLPAAKRSFAIAFTINGKGYVGMGSSESNNLNDLYEYDPLQNTWIAKANFPGKARLYSVASSLNDKGYTGLGVDAKGNFYKDWWQFDPQQNTWTRQTDFPLLRWGASAVHAGNNIYVGMGVPYTGEIDTMYAINDWWQFTPAASVTQNETVTNNLSSKIIISPNPFKDSLNFRL